MASAAAQNYFNSLPPAEQQRALASWGGADLMDEWYANAVAAGAVPEARPANYAGPNDAEAQGYNYSAGVTGASGWQPGQGITPQQLRRLSAEQGWSEDFNRYSDAQLQAWIDSYWDPNAGRFRSEHGAEGTFDKPTECPPGTTLHGSRCVGWDQLPFELGGTATSGPAGGGGGAAGPMGSGLLYAPKPKEADQFAELQRSLEDQFLSRKHIFGMADSRTGPSGIAPDLWAKSFAAGGLLWGDDKNMFEGMPGVNLGGVSTTAAPAPRPQTPVQQAALAVPQVSTPAGYEPPKRTALEETLYSKFRPQRDWSYREGVPLEI